MNVAGPGVAGAFPSYVIVKESPAGQVKEPTVITGNAGVYKPPSFPVVQVPAVSVVLLAEGVVQPDGTVIPRNEVAANWVAAVFVKVKTKSVVDPGATVVGETVSF